MMNELEERIIQFLKITEKHNLCFKRSKCDFNMEEIPILGVVIEKGQVQMEEDNIKTVKEWKTLKRSREWKVSWGLQIFIKDLSRILVIQQDLLMN